jgi:excisionase family DNA binding protein
MEDRKKQITPEFMSRKDLAAYASVSVRTVSAWIQRDMPHYRIGNLLRIKRSEFDERVKRFSVEDPGTKLQAMADEVLQDLGIPIGRGGLQGHQSGDDRPRWTGQSLKAIHSGFHI